MKKLHLKKPSGKTGMPTVVFLTLGVDIYSDRYDWQQISKTDWGDSNGWWRLPNSLDCETPKILEFKTGSLKPQERPLPDDVLRPFLDYYAIADQIANEGLMQSFSSASSGDPELVKRVEKRYRNAWGMFTKLGELVDLQGKWAEKELGLAVYISLPLGNIIRNLEEVDHITHLPALHDAYTALQDHVAILKRFEKKHGYDDLRP